MWDLGRDRIFASAAVALLLTAPVCALAQEQAVMPTGDQVTQPVRNRRRHAGRTEPSGQRDRRGTGT